MAAVGGMADPRHRGGGVSVWPRRSAVGLIRVYQKLVSPAMAPKCRYQPSCSEYTAVAISRFGVVRGSWLGARRIGRCHPLRPGGFDPVPDNWRAN